MNSPLIDQYKSEKIWYRKILVMEIFHCMMQGVNKNWGVRQTAKALKVSVGLVSENLQIAKAIHENESLITACTNRKEALYKVVR